MCKEMLIFTFHAFHSWPRSGTLCLPLTCITEKIFSVSIFQCCFRCERQKKKTQCLTKTASFSGAYLSQKVLNLCYKHTHLNRKTRTALKYIIDPNTEVPESAKLGVVCTTLQNILLGQVKQNRGASGSLKKQLCIHVFFCSPRQNHVCPAVGGAHGNNYHEFQHVFKWVHIIHWCSLCLWWRMWEKTCMLFCSATQSFWSCVWKRDQVPQRAHLRKRERERETKRETETEREGENCLTEAKMSREKWETLDRDSAYPGNLGDSWYIWLRVDI